MKTPKRSIIVNISMDKYANNPGIERTPRLSRARTTARPGLPTQDNRYRWKDGGVGGKLAPRWKGAVGEHVTRGLFQKVLRSF